MPVGELNETCLIRLLNQRVQSDEKGRVHVEGLFPGLAYDLFTVREGDSRVIHVTRGLRFEPGQARDLGEMKPNVTPPAKKEK